MRRSTQIPFSSILLPTRSPLLALLGIATASLLLVAMTGCAQILGIEDLPDWDGGVPFPPDGRPIPPGEFGISSVTPNRVTEGEGAAWAVPILVSGEGFTSDTRVVLNGAGFDQQEIVPVVSAGGRLLAFPLSVPVLPDVPRGQSATITVTVRDGAQNDAIDLPVSGLNELVISELGDTTLEASQLDPLYSRIHIDEAIELTGPALVRLVATSEIRLEAPVYANGKNASGTTAGAGGPGGCAGGALASNGACDTGGGGGNGRDDGAGGGGHFTVGTPGGGNPVSPGGMVTGREDLVPLGDESGHGGGGSSLSGGGGGGGIVELTSRGTFVVDLEGSVSVDGGRGGPGQCTSSLVGGSGGGGSGGAILIRAWDGFDDQVDEPRLSTRGGQGGDMLPDRNCVEVGGAGSPGRVRVDTAALGGLPGFTRISPEPWQGTLFRNIDNAGNPVPVITTEPQITLQAVGGGSNGFTLDVNGFTQAITLASDGTASMTATLDPGPNQVCAKTSANTSIDVSEGVQCISIAYIQ